MIEGLLLADPSTGKVSTTCKELVHRSIGVFYYHTHMQHHNDFIIYNFFLEQCEITTW
jgi:hypothetical protein